MIDVYYSPIDGGWMADYFENYQVIFDTGPHPAESEAVSAIKNQLRVQHTSGVKDEGKR